jgi:hypothetical protein
MLDVVEQDHGNPCPMAFHQVRIAFDRYFLYVDV